MSDDFYGILKKEVVDELKLKVDGVLDGNVNSEDCKLDILKQISNLEIKLDRISEEDETFDKSEFQKKMRFDALIEREKELWERVKSFGRD